MNVFLPLAQRKCAFIYQQPSLCESVVPWRRLFRVSQCENISWSRMRSLPCAVFQHVCRGFPAAGGGLPGWERLPGQQLRGPQSTQRAALLRVWPVPAVDLRQLGRGGTGDNFSQFVLAPCPCVKHRLTAVPFFCSAPSRAVAASRPGWWCVSVPTASASTTWAARSTTSRRIASSATRSHVRLARNGVQTHGARYAHERHSVVVVGVGGFFCYVFFVCYVFWVFFFPCVVFSASTSFSKKKRQQKIFVVTHIHRQCYNCIWCSSRSRRLLPENSKTSSTSCSFLLVPAIGRNQDSFFFPYVRLLGVYSCCSRKVRLAHYQCAWHWQLWP